MNLKEGIISKVNEIQDPILPDELLHAIEAAFIMAVYFLLQSYVRSGILK